MINQTTEENIVITTKEKDISIIPSIRECEKFSQFLNIEFNLGLPENIIFTIEQKSPKFYGYFMPEQKGEKLLNTITLNSIYLKDNHQYITIAHEVAHYYNSFLGISDCSSNQYHNKHFKKVAEMLKLEVVKTKKGYSQTNSTPEFEELLLKFNPTPNIFDIFQNHSEKPKNKSRLDKKCECGTIIYASKNFNGATCLICEKEFINENTSISTPISIGECQSIKEKTVYALGNSCNRNQGIKGEIKGNSCLNNNSNEEHMTHVQITNPLYYKNLKKKLKEQERTNAKSDMDWDMAMNNPSRIKPSIPKFRHFSPLNTQNSVSCC